MAKTIGQLVNQAVEIRDERDTGDNTATRVGEMFIAIIEHLRDVSDVNSSGNGNNSSINLTGLLSSLSGMTDPDGNQYPNGAVLKYSGGAWGYDNYGGGTTTTTGGGLTVAQLWTELDNPTTQYAANKVIPKAYLDLSDCIKTNATFWGNTINNNVVNGSLAGNISYIKFDYNNHTVYLGLDSDGNLRVSSDNGSGTANFYATGGVSALGYGSSGSGGNTSSDSSSAPLDSNILKSINGFTASGVSNPSAGDLVYYSSNGWVYKKLGINDLTDVTISNLPSTSSDVIHVLTYDNTLGIWKNAPISTTGGASNLNGLSDVTISGISNASSYPVVLSKLRSTDTDFINTPLNNLFAEGNGINITTQTGTGSSNNKLLIGLEPATTSTIGGIQVFGTGSSSITPQSGTTTHKYYGVYLDGSNKAYVDVPWTDNDHIYSNGNGLNLSSGGEFSIDDSYLNAGWVTLNTQQIISATKTFTDHQILANNKALKAKDTNGSNLSIVEFDVNNQLAIGWNTTTETHEYDTLVFGNTIKLYSGNAQIGKKEAIRVLPSGVVELALATTGPKSGNTYTGAGPAAGLRIGDAVLYWDEENQALALAKYNASTPSSPTAANFYATGGVSALGMSNGTGSVGAMTFGNLTVNDELNVASTLLIGNASIAESGDDIMIDLEGNNLILSGSLYMSSYSISFGDYNTPDTLQVRNHHLYFNDTQIA